MTTETQAAATDVVDPTAEGAETEVIDTKAVDTTAATEGAVEQAGGQFLAVSDEDIMNANSPEEYQALLDKAAGKAAAATAKADEAKEDAADAVVEGGEGKEDGDKEADKADEGAESDAADKDKKVEPEQKPDDLKKDEVKPTEDKSKVVVDFEAEYKKLLAPFKANGHEIEVKSVDDAISLMQMGANYNKKMAGLKPSLKLVKMLEQSGFLSEEKVGFLIDLGKKDPAAINKLISESGINPMDLDAEKASGYKQNTFAPSDVELDLDTVLDEISSTPTYNRTLNVVGQQWDAASKKVVAEQPALLKIVNDHMERGIYDVIAKEVVSERLFGRLSGLNDIQAYQQVGDRLNAAGKFNAKVAPAAKPATEPKVVVPALKKPVADELKDKRRAASSTKPVAPKGVAAEFNPLALSDEEFTKLANAR